MNETKFFPIYRGTSAGTVIAVVSMSLDDFQNAMFGKPTKGAPIVAFRYADESRTQFQSRMNRDLGLPLDHAMWAKPDKA